MAGDPCDYPDMGRWQALDLDQESGPKMELGLGLGLESDLAPSSLGLSLDLDLDGPKEGARPVWPGSPTRSEV